VLAGEQLTGLFVQTPHPIVPELLGRLGADVLCIDAEHGALGRETVHALVAATPVHALVRVAETSAAAVGSALDAGAAGVLVPRIESAAAAAAAVGFARYPPQGERGIGPARSNGYGRAIPAALARANDEVLVAVQIETRAGLDALDEIAAVQGLDMIFVGPGDLSASLGLAGGIADPALPGIVEGALARAGTASRARGVFAFEPEQGAVWIARGIELVLVGSDLAFLAAGVEAAWARLTGPAAERPR
jgi:4-hydroxy-2-oxoheptanedioate aldolase